MYASLIVNCTAYLTFLSLSHLKRTIVVTLSGLLIHNQPILVSPTSAKVFFFFFNSCRL